MVFRADVAVEETERSPSVEIFPATQKPKKAKDKPARLTCSVDHRGDKRVLPFLDPAMTSRLSGVDGSRSFEFVGVMVVLSKNAENASLESVRCDGGVAVGQQIVQFVEERRAIGSFGRLFEKAMRGGWIGFRPLAKDGAHRVRAGVGV
jgi:hypothetical protein